MYTHQAQNDANASDVGYSAKAWAIGGTEVTTTASRGAAKEWATSTGGAVDTSEFSAKAYAIGGTGVTDTAAKGAAKDAVSGALTDVATDAVKKVAELTATRDKLLAEAPLGNYCADSAVSRG